MRMGNSQINVAPCTQAEENANWAQIVQNFNTINNTITDGAVDNFTVKTDDTDSNPEFLFPKLFNQSTYDGAVHQPVYAAVYVDSGDRKVRLFTAIADSGPDGVGDHKVLVSGADTTAEYLHASMKDAGTYDSATDSLILAAIADPAANEKLRQFLRIDGPFLTQFFNQITIDGGSWDSDTLTLAISGGGAGGGHDGLIVLIDADIDGITEYDESLTAADITLTGPEISEGMTIVLQQPPGTPVDALPLREFKPKLLALKYFREAVASDPGYVLGTPKLVLATSITDNHSTHVKTIVYDTVAVWYLDGESLVRGEYERIDYPAYPENEAFPPDGAGTFQEPPAGFLKKVYRAQAKYAVGRYWLDFETCKAVPPPAFTEAS